MANSNDPNITVAIALPTSYATYLDSKAAAKDQNRSQVVRAMIRRDMEEDAQTKPKKQKKGLV